MKPKLNIIVSILLIVFLIITYITGVMIEEYYIFKNIHETIAGIFLVLFVAHIIGHLKNFHSSHRARFSEKGG